MFDEQLVALCEADTEVLILYGGCIELGGELAILSDEALQFPRMLPLELPNFVREPVAGAFGGSRAEVEGCEVGAVTDDRDVVTASLSGEAVGEGGDGGIMQLLRL